MASARTRSKAAPTASAAPEPAGADVAALARVPFGGDVAALLQGAAEEAARLLGADGAFLYLLDPESGMLRFMHSAGIAELAPGHRMRTLQLPVGVGMFGKAVADRRVVVTGNYVADERFVHADTTDSFVDEIGICSMVVAPLTAGDEVFGALGTFSNTLDAFTAPQIALVRALSDHAALAMANARLIEELAHSREAIERRASIERSLRELGTRISGARDPGAVVQYTIDEALRLLDGDGARIDIVDPEVRQLRGMYSSGEERILETEWPRDPDDRLEVGASGRATTTGQTYISRDYLADEQLVHGHGPDTYARNKGIRGVIASPLFGDQGPFGAITVWSTKEDAFTPEHAVLLETIAGQSAVALGRARLIEELGRSRETLARRAEEERALREIASRLGAMGDDPADILNRIVHETARLLGGERARLDLLEPLSGSWLWTYPPETPFNDRIVAAELVGGGADGRPTGLAGLAIQEGRPVASGDYMHDERFTHYTEGDRGVTEVGLHSIVATPVVGEEGLLGVLQAGHRAKHAFGDDATRLIAALASQATIAITNARLVDRLASSQAALGRTAESERALREIARRMMVIQDPAELLQDVVDEAARLLGSSGAVIDLLDPATGEVHWAYDAGIEDATRAEWQRRGVGGDGVFLAIRERRVVTTDDYAGGRAVRGRARERRLLRRGRGPLDRVRAAHRRGDGAGHARRLRRGAGPLRAGPGGDPRRARRPGHDRDPQRGADQRARPLARGDGPPRRDRADAARDRGPGHVDPRARGDPGPDRRRDAARARLGRGAPHPDERGPDVRAPGRHRGRHGHRDARLAPGPGVPARRRHQRARGGPGTHRLDPQLRDRPADPARRGGPRGRRADGPRRDGRGPAPRPRRRGHRHARRELPEARLDLARPAGDAPGARRPRGHRPLELGPARPARGVRDELPQPRPGDARRDLAQRRRGPVHVHGRGRRAAVRLDRGRPRRAATSRTSSPRSRRPTRARPGSS